MNAEWKAKWIAALRSGKYPRTQGKLRRPTGFCCLGVLCDLVDPLHWSPTATVVTYDHKNDYFIYGTDETPAYNMPPRQVYDITGLTQAQANELANRNDHGASFEEIAEIIEGHL